MISVGRRHGVALATLLLFCCPVLVMGQQSGSRDVSALIGGLYKSTRLAGGTHSMVAVTAAVVFTLVSQPPSLRAQDDISPSSPETKKQGGLYDLLAPADREKKAPIPALAEREKARELIREAF